MCSPSHLNEACSKLFRATGIGVFVPCVDDSQLLVKGAKGGTGTNIIRLSTRSCSLTFSVQSPLCILDHGNTTERCDGVQRESPPGLSPVFARGPIFLDYFCNLLSPAGLLRKHFVITQPSHGWIYKWDRARNTAQLKFQS